MTWLYQKEIRHTKRKLALIFPYSANSSHTNITLFKLRTENWELRTENWGQVRIQLLYLSNQTNITNGKTSLTAFFWLNRLQIIQTIEGLHRMHYLSIIGFSSSAKTLLTSNNIQAVSRYKDRNMATTSNYNISLSKQKNRINQMPVLVADKALSTAHSG